MIADFFIWCAGTDTNVLSKCEDSVRTKHIGIGTLVLIPAFLGFISMSYALSTISLLTSKPYMFYVGGFIWGLIVFSFDRYIVSTHRKQQTNLAEFLNITFYLRLSFAFVLGVVVSHPFVLLYFDGSITERIIKDQDNAIKTEEVSYQQSYKSLKTNVDSLYAIKRCREQLLTAEQSGHVLHLSCGSSSGIPNISGTFPRTLKIENQIKDIDSQIQYENARIKERNEELLTIKKNAQLNILNNTSFDYLKREITLEKLKKENKIIGLTELFLMLAFILVDVLPLVFKTFSPFSMYDKILYDDANILKDININSRKTTLQLAYDKISGFYVVHKNLDTAFGSKDYIAIVTKKYNLSLNILIGLILGIFIFVCLYYFGEIDITRNQLFSLATAISLVISIIANFITDLIRRISKPLTEEK